MADQADLSDAIDELVVGVELGRRDVLALALDLARREDVVHVFAAVQVWNLACSEHKSEVSLRAD